MFKKKTLLVRGTHDDLEHPEGIQPPDKQKTSIQSSEPSRRQYLGSFVSSYRHFSKKNLLPMQTTAVRKTIDSKLNHLFDKSGTFFHPALSSWWFLACPDGKIPEDLTILTPWKINSWNLKKPPIFFWKRRTSFEASTKPNPWLVWGVHPLN